MIEKIKKEIWEKVEKRISDAVRKMEAAAAASPEDIFNFTYEEMPWFLKEQMNEMMQAMQKAKEVEVK